MSFFEKYVDDTPSLFHTSAESDEFVKRGGEPKEHARRDYEQDDDWYANHNDEWIFYPQISQISQIFFICENLRNLRIFNKAGRSLTDMLECQQHRARCHEPECVSRDKGDGDEVGHKRQDDQDKCDEYDG